MATCTFRELNVNFHRVMSSRVGIKKMEKEPVRCAVKAEKDPSDTSANRVPDKEILPLFNKGKLEECLVLVE